MNLEIHVRDLFGSFCDNGEAAARYCVTNIEPYLGNVDEVRFDFAGVRNMGSSFCNAMFANMVSRHPEAFAKLRFANCRRGLDELIASALEMGLASQEGRNATGV